MSKKLTASIQAHGALGEAATNHHVRSSANLGPPCYEEAKASPMEVLSGEKKRDTLPALR